MSITPQQWGSLLIVKGCACLYYSISHLMSPQFTTHSKQSISNSSSFNYSLLAGILVPHLISYLYKEWQQMSQHSNSIPARSGTKHYNLRPPSPVKPQYRY